VRPAELPAVAGVGHRCVEVNGVRLHVAEAGSGPPLLLLHGWPQHWWCWRHLIPALAEDHRVLVPDLRGWGWSEAPAGDYSKATFADDVLALIDAEHFERVDLIGHDWGGYVGYLLALKHPERIRRMTVLDMPPPGLDKPRPRHLALPLLGSYQALIAAPVIGTRALSAGGGRLVRRLIAGGSGPTMRWSDAELDAYAEVVSGPARARASSACYRAFLTRELPRLVLNGHRPGELRVPTLLAMGEKSPLRRVLAPRPSRNLRVEQITGAGRFLPEEAPGAVLELAVADLSACRGPCEG
jgi:pimeloyl-ACP methyl ester carboxylesterase